MKGCILEANSEGLDSVIIKTIMIIYHFVVVDPDLGLEILFFKREGNKGVLILK